MDSIKLLIPITFGHNGKFYTVDEFSVKDDSVKGYIRLTGIAAEDTIVMSDTTKDKD